MAMAPEGTKAAALHLPLPLLQQLQQCCPSSALGRPTSAQMLASQRCGDTCVPSACTAHACLALCFQCCLCRRATHRLLPPRTRAQVPLPTVKLELQKHLTQLRGKARTEPSPAAVCCSVVIDHCDTRASSLHQRPAPTHHTCTSTTTCSTPCSYTTAHHAPALHSLTRCLQLVDAINEDHGEFVALGSRLASIEGAVTRMRQPLLEIQVCYNMLL